LPYQYNSSNELTSTPSASYTYDANGDVTAETNTNGTTQFGWDFENRLTQAVVPGTNGGTTTFKYDPFGRRIQKSGPLGMTNYLYDGVSDIEEVDGAGNILARYTEGRTIDEPLSELRSGSAIFYEQDGLGSVASLSSGAGALAGTYTYDSFGNLTASTGSLTNPFRFTGRELDQETGIYQYRARYFDPTDGRFISEDPFGFAAGMNFFTYVHNSPVVLDDPMGLCDKDNCQLSINCGATANTYGFSHCTVFVQNGPNYTAYDGEPTGLWLWSQLAVQINPHKGHAPDAYSFVKNVPVPCDCAQKAANDINSSNMVYSAPFQNSNTAAAMMAADCGVYPNSWPALGAHGPIGTAPPVNSNPWSPFNPWPPMQ
jgi:RHS repeat-associated protein